MELIYSIFIFSNSKWNNNVLLQVPLSLGKFVGILFPNKFEEQQNESAKYFIELKSKFER